MVKGREILFINEKSEELPKKVSTCMGTTIAPGFKDQWAWSYLLLWIHSSVKTHLNKPPSFQRCTHALWSFSLASSSLIFTFCAFAVFVFFLVMLSAPHPFSCHFSYLEICFYPCPIDHVPFFLGLRWNATSGKYFLTYPPTTQSAFTVHYNNRLHASLKIVQIPLSYISCLAHHHILSQLLAHSWTCLLNE